MKQIKTLALLSLLWGGFSLSSSHAQVDVTVNPFGLLFGDINIGADFNIKEDISIEPNIGVGFGDNDAFEYTNIPVTVFGKYYFSPKNGCDKFYADAFLRFVRRSYSVEDETTNYAEYSQTRFGLGLGIGYKVASAKGFIFDINFGVGRALIDNTKFESEGEQFEASWTNVMIIGKLGLGYRFGGK